MRHFLRSVATSLCLTAAVFTAGGADALVVSALLSSAGVRRMGGAVSNSFAAVPADEARVLELASGEKQVRSDAALLAER